MNYCIQVFHSLYIILQSKNAYFQLHVYQKNHTSFSYIEYKIFLEAQRPQFMQSKPCHNTQAIAIKQLHYFDTTVGSHN